MASDDKDRRIAALERQLAARTRERDELLRQQTATAEVLGIISQSPADVRAVLMAVAERAARFCEANDAGILHARGDELFRLAHYGAIEPGLATHEGLPIIRGIVAGRAVIDRCTVHVDDLAAAADEFPEHQ